MEIRAAKKDSHKVKSWPGGTTTQLMIYPEQAEYEKRNFRWRISSAEIELEESIFTRLPGFNRILMVIEGNLQIEHEGHYSTCIGPFRQEHFKGEWITKSHGKAVDFNLMMDSSCFGEIEALSVKENGILPIPKYEAGKNYEFVTESFYAVKGSANVTIGMKASYCIRTGDILSITGSTTEAQADIEIANLETEDFTMIRSIVFY